MRDLTVLWLLPLLLVDCANDNREGGMPFSPSLADAGIELSARMVKGSPRWDVAVTFTNKGPTTAELIMGGCGVQAHFMDGPDGRVVWAGYPPFVACTMNHPKYRIVPGDSLVLVAVGPPYRVRQEMAGRQYYVRARVVLDEPEVQTDLDIGWVLLQ